MGQIQWKRRAILLSNLESWAQWMREDPAQFAVYALFLVLTVMMSLTLHEVAHGYVAYRCGDPTAKMLGRLTLNPVKHLDPFGTICLFLLGFGWAKPVPVNPRNFRSYRRDDFMVSIAGITVNLSLFIFSCAVLVGIRGLLWKPAAFQYFDAQSLISADLMNYFHRYPENREFMTALMRTPWLQYVQQFFVMFGSINLGLGLFNLLPLPPLDGFHILNDILLKGKLFLSQNVFRVCQIALMVLCLTGALSSILNTAMGAVQNGVMNLFLMMTGAA